MSLLKKLEQVKDEFNFRANRISLRHNRYKTDLHDKINFPLINEEMLRETLTEITDDYSP